MLGWRGIFAIVSAIINAILIIFFVYFPNKSEDYSIRFCTNNKNESLKIFRKLENDQKFVDFKSLKVVEETASAKYNGNFQNYSILFGKPSCVNETIKIGLNSMIKFDSVNLFRNFF